MTSEPERFTLDEARAELRRHDCARSRHAPAIELAEIGQRASVWLCDCNAVTYTPHGATP